MSDELLNRARELLVNTPTTAFAMASAFPKMAETIRDLMAEVERLHRLADSGTADSFLTCDEATKRMAFALMIDESSRRKRAEQRIEELESENERLTERLRELASAEPVAWSFRDLHGVYHLEKGGTPPLYEHTDAFALIRRPEVKS